MSRRPWYKRYPADAITGMLMLSLEQKGAYSTVIDLIYLHGGPIEDDARYLSHCCGCSVRKWTALRDRLIDLGKLYLTADGRLSNRRADREIPENDAEAEVLAENALKSHRKRAENAPKTSGKLSENQSTSAKNNGLAEKGQLHRDRDPEARYQNNTAAAAGGRDGLKDTPPVAVAIIADTDPDAGAPALIRAFDGAILTVWGQEAARMPVPGDDATAEKWQDAGVTPELVRNVAERVFRRQRQQNRSPPKALGYLTEPLMEQLTAVATPLLRPRAPAAEAVSAPVVAMGADPVDSTWRARVSGWQRNGFWNVHQWGPAPTQPGCKVPHKILLDLRITSEVA